MITNYLEMEKEALLCTMHEMMHYMLKDFEKAAIGQKLASQRIRTTSIELSKVFKAYRKVSVESRK